MSAQSGHFERVPVGRAIPHTPDCGLKVLDNGRHRAVCVCDEETHQRRLDYIRTCSLCGGTDHREWAH